MEQYCQNKSNKTKNKIAIVGAGPSGIYCAIHILRLFSESNFTNYFLTIFDKSQALRTILPTGNSRCNITNAESDIDTFLNNYPRGKKFLKSVFNRHFNYDTIDFFNSIGIDTYADSNNRFFPKSNSSKEVKDKMLSELNKYKNFKIVNKNITSKSNLEGFDYIIISSGSKNTEELITSFNHTLIPFKKALVGLRIENMIYPQGVSLKTADGDIIFTKKGISGPCALTLSSVNANRDFPYEIKLAMFKLEELLSLIKANPKKSIGNIVSMLVPKSIAKVIVKDFNKKASEISKKDLEDLCYLKLKIIGTEEKGEMVRAGGVDLDELDKNCKSKIHKNLWYCGEILNIDGFCGGFNLQNCWSTAYVAAKDVVKIINMK